MTNRCKIIFSTLLCGALLISFSTTIAKAETAKHRHSQTEHKHREHVAVEKVQRESRRQVQAKRHSHQLAQIQETGRRHRSKRVAREDAPVLSRGERKRMFRERQLAELQTKQQIRMAKLMHAKLVRITAEMVHEQRLMHAAALKAHIAELSADRKEHLAEMSGALSSKSIRAWQAYVLSVPIRLISVDLNDPTVKVSGLLAQNGIGSAESFQRMIRRSQPDVAVTGTFFSLDNLKPVGDIVINGDLAYFGGMGTALCITRDNRAEMVTVPWGHHHDWSNYDFVMACGPRLLEDHEIVLDPQGERFHDKHMLAPNSRIGVGITATNKLVFVMTKKPIYLGRLAKIMRSLGCSQAMNLDAGTSTGFYYEGNMMASPGRWLTNAIVVYANQKPIQTQPS